MERRLSGACKNMTRKLARQVGDLLFLCSLSNELERSSWREDGSKIARGYRAILFYLFLISFSKKIFFLMKIKKFPRLYKYRS